MTHEEKINAIREKCVAVNPEIVELKFGCEITTGPQTLKFVRDIEDGSCMTDIGRFHGWIGSGMILGRPIRLADVLLAIGDSIDNDYADGVIPENFEEQSFMAERTRLKKWSETCQHWNLRADDLTLQDSSTIDFIHRVLCGV